MRKKLNAPLFSSFERHKIMRFAKQNNKFFNFEGFEKE